MGDGGPAGGRSGADRGRAARGAGLEPGRPGPGQPPALAQTGSEVAQLRVEVDRRPLEVVGRLPADRVPAPVDVRGRDLELGPGDRVPGGLVWQRLQPLTPAARPRPPAG